jgi:hypothetical protein
VQIFLPGRVDAGAAFSVLFTLWLSRKPAVGLASRPIFSVLLGGRSFGTERH